MQLHSLLTGTTSPKSYLISRIAQEYHKHNEAVAELVGGDVFIPHQHNPYNIAHQKLEYPVFKTDWDAMESADFAVVALPIGEDCSCEVGWFAGNKKPVFAIMYDSDNSYTDEEQYILLKKLWMVKGFLSGVYVVNNKGLYNKICLDPILKDKVEYFIYRKQGGVAI
jgi:nucleoside 2-deoxyribosyltransferase